MDSSRSDAAWEHCLPMEGNKYGTICKYCGHANKSGGITRFKYHLTGTDPKKNTKKCPSVPPEVKTSILVAMNQKDSSKAKAKAVEEHIREELRGGLAGQAGSDSDEDVFIYPPNMHPSERNAYRQALRESKATQWEADKRQRGSGPGESSSFMTRSASMREPALYKSDANRQRKMKDMMSKGGFREKMGRLISKFFIYDNVPPAKASSHHFKNMVAGIQEAGSGVLPPTPYEIKTKYLDLEYKEMETYVNSLKTKWANYGCTVMSDGWTGPTKLSIINFMVYCKGNTIFLKSVDASNKIKDHDYIYGLLKDVIKEVGTSNVVQVVTDNGSAFVKAGKKLMQKYNLYWTPCAAHCIDLMFEDIGKQESVAATIREAREVTNFIYNHGTLLAAVRDRCGGDIVRPGATRFATNFIALNSLLQKKGGLKQVFTSDTWFSGKLSKTTVGRDIECRVLNNGFWDRVQGIVDIYEPMYTVLRIVDSEVVPTMPLIYDIFNTMKQRLGTLKNRK